MAWGILRIPSAVVNIVREIEEFFVFMRWNSQASLEKHPSMEKLIDIVLNVWNVLEYEVGADVGHYKYDAKGKYDEIQWSNAVEYPGDRLPESK